ncbi:unnamed protein product [Symbiodinium sp. CCMP2456]|nr:unnamed protein product [Symbiodinium sp. CCMP2456]
MELGWKIRATAAANKSLVPLSRDEARLDPLLGATIRKIFGSQWYYGQVIAIDADAASGERAYHVAYEDGDEEHLSAVEVKHFLASCSRALCSTFGGWSLHAAFGSRHPAAQLGSDALGETVTRSGTSCSKANVGKKPRRGQVRLCGPSLRSSCDGLGHGTRLHVPDLFSKCAQFLLLGLARLMESEQAQAAPPEVAGSSLQRSVEVCSSAGGAGCVGSLVQATLSCSDLQDVEEPAPPKEEREIATEIVTDDVEIFVDVPSQADDTTSALHTSLLNEASYAEHLEPAGGGADAESVAVQTADDELAAAAAALVEASGLVVRVAGRAFVRMLEEAWHSLLGGVSATLCSAVGVSGWMQRVFIQQRMLVFSVSGVLYSLHCKEAGRCEGSESIEAVQLGANDEAGSAGLESLMTSALVACAGARALKGAKLSTNPAFQKWGQRNTEVMTILVRCPDTSAHDPTSRGFAVCVAVAGVRVVACSFASHGVDGDARQLDSRCTQGAQMLAHREKLASTRTGIVLKQRSERLPVSMADSIHAGTRASGSQDVSDVPLGAHPGTSLVVFASCFRDALGTADSTEFRAQGTLFVCPFLGFGPRSADIFVRMTAAKPRFHAGVEKPRQDYTAAAGCSFIQGGRLRPLRVSASSRRQLLSALRAAEGQEVLSGSGSNASKWSRCPRAELRVRCRLDTVFCRGAGRAKSKQADKSRFRHTKALSKLKEMGYDDSEEVREVLTKCNGDLNAALREITGPGTRA